MSDARTYVFLVGFVVGILLIADARLGKSLSPVWVTGLTGALFGAVVAWTIIDGFHVLRNPDELTGNHSEPVVPLSAELKQ